MNGRILSILISVSASSAIFFAGAPTYFIPPGFSLVTADAGIALYRKGYPDGYPDFVQVIHLDQGATVKLLHGTVLEPGIGQGNYGGDNPALARQTLQEAWNEFASSHPDAFCITNGQFFSAGDDRAALAFPLKAGGKMVSDGYARNAYPHQKLMLEIWRDRADIVPLSEEALRASSAPDILAGLSEDASGRRPNRSTGRTFVGLDDRNHDGEFETILIFSSKIARKTEAAGVLRRFGADKVMMLDGGGSTQLICQGRSYVSASREIPQTIAVVAARTLIPLRALPVQRPAAAWSVPRPPR